jgi:hypothetical protein
MTAATSHTLFASAGPAPTPTDIADDHTLLTLDRELDFLLEQIDDEIEENGEASKEAMERLQLFCQAMNVKVDRVGRYLSVMKTRAAHCKEEAARYAARDVRAATASGLLAEQPSVARAQTIESLLQRGAPQAGTPARWNCRKAENDRHRLSQREGCRNSADSVGGRLLREHHGRHLAPAWQCVPG